MRRERRGGESNGLEEEPVDEEMAWDTHLSRGNSGLKRTGPVCECVSGHIYVKY